MNVSQICLHSVTGSVSPVQSPSLAWHTTPFMIWPLTLLRFYLPLFPCLVFSHSDILKCLEWVYFSGVCLFITDSTLYLESSLLADSGIEQTHLQILALLLLVLRLGGMSLNLCKPQLFHWSKEDNSRMLWGLNQIPAKALSSRQWNVRLSIIHPS